MQVSKQIGSLLLNYLAYLTFRLKRFWNLYFGFKELSVRV